VNRQTAAGMLNDAISREGSGKEEWLKMDEI
jgi:hypothetical protein